MEKLKNLLDRETYIAQNYTCNNKPLVEEYCREDDFDENKLPNDPDDLEEEGLHVDPVLQELEKASFLLENRRVLKLDEYIRKYGK